MADTRIITLSPSQQGGQTSVSAFEEAFGEYSEARGRGRARRKKRRLERIANRKEVTAARQEARKEKRVGRQEVRQAVKQARIAKRAAAQADRQAKRTAAMASRQEKKFQRKDMRLRRKALGDSPETEMDDQTMIENGAVTPTPMQDNYQDTDTGGQQEDSGQYAPEETQGGGQQGGGQQGGGYQGSEEEWGGGGYQGPTWGDESEVDEGGQASGQEDYSEESEEGSYGEDSGDSEFDGEDSSFEGYSDDDTDGLIALEDTYNEFNDEGNVRIPPGVGETAKKIEWNKELVARLKEKAQTNPSMSREINTKINSRMKRIAELEQTLSKYQNFEGDFSSADGEFIEYSEASGRRRAPVRAKQGRVKQVIKAKARAISERKGVSKEGAKSLMNKLSKVYPPAIAVRKVKQMMANRKAAQNGGDVTPVESELNPEFSEQRIEVPADEIATAFNGLRDDFAEPVGRFVELSSNADGDKNKKINWTGIAIGVGVAAVAIWAIRKYKIFK
jgi:hypothetical protein